MPPQPYVFISYSHAEPDAEYVDRLAVQLTEAGVPVWYDRHTGPTSRNRRTSLGGAEGGR